MRGITALDGILVLSLAAAAAIVVVPQRRVDRILDHEDEIVADLRDLDRRLAEHQKAARRDADRDGVGEYPPLDEVIGSRDARKLTDTGIWELDGYRFAVMTPGPRKLPVLAGTPGAPTDWAELSYLIVAWPAEPGVTGMRAYCRTPGGVLVHQIDGYPYGDAPPHPEWTMIVTDGERVRRNGRPYDGGDWKAPARELRR